MKLKKLIEAVLDEVDSEAAAEAKQMGLVYKGYGRWADPKTNQVVAKTIQGKLVKIENGADDGSMAAQQGAEPGVDSPVEADPVDSENPVPVVSTALEKMLAAAGGDSLKLRKALVKKFRDGNPNAQKWLTQLDQHDEKEKAGAQAAVQAVADRKAAELAAKKAKYAAMYPSPNI